MGPQTPGHRRATARYNPAMPWRRVIWAVMCGFVVMGGAFGLALLLPLHHWAAKAMDHLTLGALPKWTCEGFGNLFVALVVTEPGLLVAATIASLVSRDPETRCRKCGYILRGISEPRCPECGERI